MPLGYIFVPKNFTNLKTITMETNLKLFKNSEFGEIRVSEVNNEPLFCLSDVCKALDIINVSDCKARLRQKGIVLTDTPTNGGIQKILFIDESNLYQCVFASKKKEAIKFRDWICDEVLPSIRKTGGYIISKEDDTAETILARAVLVANETINKQKEKLSLLEQEKELNKPKVLFADSVSASNSSCLIGELAKILRQNGIEIGQNRLFEILREKGYLCKTGESYNHPTQRSMDLGLFEIKKTSIVKPSGTFISTTTKVTGKGIIYFIDKFLNK